MDSSPKKKKKLKEINATLSKDELIRRLKTAAQELTNVDQGEDTSDYNEFAAAVAQPFILNHKDKDVKSYAACCLADVLRIFAPEPPYNEDDLKDIFRMILQQLKHLENVQGPTYKRYFYILESLALVKTFNVCMEIDASDIVQDLFKLFFSIVSEEHNVRVKNFMLDIMCPLLQEGDSISQDLLNIILLTLVNPHKSRAPQAYMLACQVVERCSQALEPYIQLFFNNKIVLGADAAGGSEIDDNVYELVYELYKINKSVLLAVLPQLEFKLKGNEEGERLETIKLLGRMFADEDIALAETNKPLWNCYLSRFLDVCPDVRLECVKMAKQFLLCGESVLRIDITEQLLNRLLDPDERVRLEVVVTVCDSAVEDFDMVHEKLLQGVVDRIRDKKWLIRREAVTCIGKLYKRLFSNAKSSKESRKRMMNIPSKILHLYFQNSLEDRLCIERVVHSCLIPITLPVEERMKRLLNVYTSLDELAVQTFDGMLKHRARVNKDFALLLEKQESGDEMYTQTMIMARHLPEPAKAQEHITKLMAMCKNRKMYELLCKSTSVKEECPKIIKAVSEVIKTITSKSPIIETVKALLDRSCSMLIDAQSFTHLLSNIKDYLDEFGDDDEDEDDADILMKGKTGLQLVEVFAVSQPSLFQTKSCYEILMMFITHANGEIVERALRILQNIMSDIEVVDKQMSGSFQPVLMKLITQGSSKQAKYAMRCIKVLLKDSVSAIERLFKTLTEKLDVGSSSYNLRGALAALTELAVLCPRVFESNHTSVIREFAVKEILMKDREKMKRGSKENEDEWGSDSDISDETLTKLQAIKLLTGWLIGAVSKHAENAKPVFRLLTTLLNNDGDLTNGGKISAVNRSRLRLGASLAMLKLVQNVNYVDVITIEQYQQLALTMQDSCFEVREQFTAKLHKALNALKLPLDYLAYLALVAVDPSKERKVKVKQMIAQNAHTRREYKKWDKAAAARPYAILPEYSLPYVVHMLAHHPDFQHKETDSLDQTKEYVWFFLEPIMGPKAENYSFLKKLLENIKQTRDQLNPEDDETNERLYTVCDIAIGCVMNKNQTFTLKDFPGNLLLPRKLFLPDKTINNTKVYIPANFFRKDAAKQKTMLDVKTVVGKTKNKPKELVDKTKTSKNVIEKTTIKPKTEKDTSKKKRREEEDARQVRPPSKRSRRQATQAVNYAEDDDGSDGDL